MITCAVRFLKALPVCRLTSDIPVMFGVLTTDNIEQAMSVQEQKQEIKAMTVPLVLLKW